VKIDVGSKTMNSYALVFVQEWMDSFVISLLAFNTLKLILWQPMKLIILPFCLVLLFLRAKKRDKMGCGDKCQE